MTALLKYVLLEDSHAHCCHCFQITAVEGATGQLRVMSHRVRHCLSAVSSCRIQPNDSTHLQRLNVLLQFTGLHLASIPEVLQLLWLASTRLSCLIILNVAL